MNPKAHERILEGLKSKWGFGHSMNEIDLHAECISLHNQLDTVKAQNKEMLELISRIYMDIDRTNGSLYWDTVRDLKKWANKS